MSEGGVEEEVQSPLQKVGVPQGPFGVRAIGLDIRLVVSFTHFMKKILKLLVEVRVEHNAFMLVSLSQLVTRCFPT